MSDHLSSQLALIIEYLETLAPLIETTGSDEQRLLVGAMIESIKRAAPQYDDIPENDIERFMLWRHDTVRPLSLCINSTELLLTDDEQPLTEGQRSFVDRIYHTALNLNSMVDHIFETRIART